jgi:AcrR family transcriptional regulator
MDGMESSSKALDGPSDAKAAHRQRLLEGMAHSVGRRGYADTTIADIVAQAAVSRRTFYEHFQNKADCLLALYTTASRQGLAVLREAVNPSLPWQAQAEEVLRAYLGWMAQSPALTHALFTEVLALGKAGLAARRRAHGDMAEFIEDLANAAGRPGNPVSRAMALALVGGIHELMFEALEAGGGASLAELAPVAAELVRRVAGDWPGA